MGDEEIFDFDSLITDEVETDSVLVQDLDLNSSIKDEVDCDSEMITEIDFNSEIGIEEV